MLDASGQKLAYVYFESEPGRRSAAKLLSDDEARRIAGEHCSAARLPETGMNVRVASSRHLPANLNLICAAAGWLANTRPPLATDSPEKPSMTDSATSTNPSAASLRLGSSRRRTPASLCWAIRAFEANGPFATRNWSQGYLLDPATDYDSGLETRPGRRRRATRPQ